MTKRLLVVVLTLVLCVFAAPLAHGQGTGASMAFVSDVTVADDTPVMVGATFEKTWLVQNVGATDWTEAYAVAFVKGNSLSAVPQMTLGKVVRPGESIDLTVAMQAPVVPGRYTSWWQMLNEAGQPFGPLIYARIVAVAAGQSEGAAAEIVPASDVSAVAVESASSLTIDNPHGAWIWSAPKGQHDDGDVLVRGAYPILQQAEDGNWTQVKAGARTVWVYSGTHSGTHRAIEKAVAEAAAPPAVARQAPAFVATAQLLEVARQDRRRAVEMWKARIEWCEQERRPASSLSANDVPGTTKGPGVIYQVIDAQTSDIMARLPYNVCEPLLHIQHLGVFIPGRPPLGMPGPPVPAGVEALTDTTGEADIRYDYLTAPNRNFPMPADQWSKIRPWALLGALAHEGRHIMAHNGQNHQEAVDAQKQVLLLGAETLRSKGDASGAALLERLAAVVRSGSGNPVTGSF